MTELHFSAYARHRNCSPGYITKLRHEGRLVLTAGGLVDVEATDLLVEQTTGSRLDVAARNAQKRASEKTAAGEAHRIASEEKTAPGAIVRETNIENMGISMQASRAVKEKYAALKAKTEYETMIGDLISREDVETAMRFIGGAVRAALEVFPDQTAPLVAPVSNLAEIHEIITQSARDALHGIGEAIKRQQAELIKEVT